MPKQSDDLTQEGDKPQRTPHTPFTGLTSPGPKSLSCNSAPALVSHPLRADITT